MVDLLPRLRDFNNDVELLLFDGSYTPFYYWLEKEGIKIHSLGVIKNVYHPIYLFRLYFFLKKHKFDIVHTHNTAPQLYSAVVSCFYHITLCTTEHSTYNRRRAWKYYTPIDRWMYSRYKEIICISDAAEANIREHLKKKVQNIYTIYNGVDINKVTSASTNTDLREHNKRYVLIMVARYTYQKDQDTLIRAMALLPKEDYELWLVGDGERRSILENLCKELNVDDRVRFLGIRMDVPSLLKAADIVIMSSHLEGLSLSKECLLVNRL